jgi:hypothetical protein
MPVVMERQQHLESAVDCQSQLINGFFRDRQTQLFYLLIARLIIFILRDPDSDIDSDSERLGYSSIFGTVPHAPYGTPGDA